MKSNSMMYNLLKSNGGYGLTLIRIIVGIVFMSHGAQKLFGLFGGGGLEGTAGFMETLGLTPSYLMAFLAGSGEFWGGLLLVLGLVTRFAGILTGIVCLVAMFTVHIHNGFFMSNNGFEYILVLLGVSILTIFEGSGKLSIDQLIVKKLHNEKKEI